MACNFAKFPGDSVQSFFVHRLAIFYHAACYAADPTGERRSPDQSRIPRIYNNTLKIPFFGFLSSPTYTHGASLRLTLTGRPCRGDEGRKRTGNEKAHGK